MMALMEGFTHTQLLSPYVHCCGVGTLTPSHERLVQRCFSALGGEGGGQSKCWLTTRAAVTTGLVRGTEGGEDVL